MEKVKSLFLLVAILGAAMLSSCSNFKGDKVDYVPFQETKDGQWGMISMDGKVLFKDEFKNRPTLVREGRFFVKTKEGVWEMYEANEKPKKIGSDYAHASSFQNGVAVVAEKNKPVTIINTDGEVVKDLTTIDGKKVDGVRAFSQGYAAYMTEDSLWGVINTKGDCVVKAEYCALSNCSDGKFVCVSKKYKDAYKSSKKDKMKYSVINTSGEVLFEMLADKYENIGGYFVDGKMPVSVKKDGKESWGILDDKNTLVVKPSSKLKAIGNIKGDKFTYSNGDGWGLMSIKGETIIRAKYEFLYYDDDNLLIATSKDGDEYETKYIDEKDNQIGKDKYVYASSFSTFDGKHAWVKPDDKIYSIIDKDGKQVEGLPDIVNVSFSDGDTYIESDYVDLNKLLEGFYITANGLLGLTFKTTPQQAAKKEVAEGGAPGDNSHAGGSAYWYQYTKNIGFGKDIEGAHGYVSLAFSGFMSRQTYRTKRVIDDVFYDWYWYHDEKIPTGYAWNSVTPTVFTLEIYNYGRMHGKMRDLLKLLIKKFSSFGKIYKQNDGAAILNLNNGHVALIAMSKDHVTATWGKLGAASSLKIDKYKDVVEEDENDGTDFSPGELNYPDDAAVVDSVMADDYDVDSAAVVDSAAAW